MNGLPDKSPDNLATALKRDDESRTQVLAQARGAQAERMAAVAAAHNIPVLQDFALSEALKKMPVGTQIPEPLFKALGGLLDYLFREDAELARQDEETE